jgi:hypothetical protein
MEILHAKKNDIVIHGWIYKLHYTLVNVDSKVLQLLRVCSMDSIEQNNQLLITLLKEWINQHHNDKQKQQQQQQKQQQNRREQVIAEHGSNCTLYIYHNCLNI